MAHYGSFLQILQDDSPVTFDNRLSSTTVSREHSVQWEDEDSFEVSEVPNAAYSDLNLAEALRTIVTEHSELEARTQNQFPESVPTSSSSEINLKNELRAKIQTRRVSAGVGELRVKFEPPKSYPLSKEENEKVQKRKRRNRVSANRSRLKRKTHEDELQREVTDLETDNDKLSKEVALLKNLKQILSLKMATHQCTKQENVSSSLTILNTRNSGESVNTQRVTRQRTSTGYKMKAEVTSC